MKDRENIAAYIAKVQEQLKKEQKKYESVKDDYSKRMLSLDLQDRFQTQINTLHWVLKD
jgi:hypothetical protein